MERTTILFAVLGLGALSGCTAREADIALYDAIRTGQLEQVEAYLADGGDANAVIEDTPMGSVRPLKVAAYGQREQIAIALLRAGARKDLAGLSLSDFAQKGMDRALTLLLANSESPADLAEIKSAIESTVSFAYYKATEVLLSHLRSTTGSKSVSLRDALNLAISRANDDIARLLLEDGAPASGAALRAASLRSSPGLVRHLLSLGADPLEQYRDPLARPGGQDGFAALDFAWTGYQRGTPAQRQIAAFKIHDLMAAGATSTRFDAPALAMDGDALLAGVTEPSDKLLRAAQWGMYDAVRDLLSAQTARDPEALTRAVVLAIDAQWYDIARLLLAAGAPARGGPLHVAVTKNSPGLVRYLIELGADPNELVGGHTAAQYWWRSDPASTEKPRLAGGDQAILYELIAAGADVCWLGEHRDELADTNPLSLTTLLNTASKCWPEPH